MKIRLQTVLAKAGISSRRGAEEIIAAGSVKIDGKTVTEKGTKVDPKEQVVTVDGKKLPRIESKRYFLLYKPEGYITTAKDTHGRRTVLDLFKGVVDERVYPVGRLDKDTTGILLITNDGDLANKLAHPRYMIDKEYIAEVTPPLRDDQIRKIEKGVLVEGKKTAPCSIKVIKKTSSKALYCVRLHEGKKRQIKIMFEFVGGKVSKLKRTIYAGLTLGRLEEGSFRELTQGEIIKLKRLFNGKVKNGSR